MDLTEYQKNKYFGITSNGNVVEFTSLNDAKVVESILYLLEHKYMSSTGPTAYGNYNIAYLSTIYDKLGTPSTIKVNGVECIELKYSTSTATNPVGYYGFRAKIIDQGGTMREESDHASKIHYNNSLTWLFDLMKELSKHDSWGQYDLFIAESLKKKRQEEEESHKIFNSSQNIEQKTDEDLKHRKKTDLLTKLFRFCFKKSK